MIICLEIFGEPNWKNGLINIELFTPNFYWYFPISKLWEKEEEEKKVKISSKPASFYKTKRTWTRVVSMASPFLISNTKTILAVVSWFWVIAESSSFSCSISARCTTRTPRIPWTPHTIHCERKIASFKIWSWSVAFRYWWVLPEIALSKRGRKRQNINQTHLGMEPFHCRL